MSEQKDCGWDKHDWIAGEKVQGGRTYSCRNCSAIMSIGPGTIVPEKSFEERVIQTVVSDLRANGKIRMAMVGVYEQENS